MDAKRYNAKKQIGAIAENPTSKVECEMECIMGECVCCFFWVNDCATDSGQHFVFQTATANRQPIDVTQRMLMSKEKADG